MSYAKNMKILIVALFAVSRAAEITCLRLQVHSQTAPPQREHSKKIDNIAGPYHAFYDVDGTVQLVVVIYLTRYPNDLRFYAISN